MTSSTTPFSFFLCYHLCQAILASQKKDGVREVLTKEKKSLGFFSFLFFFLGQDVLFSGEEEEDRLMRPKPKG